MSASGRLRPFAGGSYGSIAFIRNWRPSTHYGRFPKDTLTNKIHPRVSAKDKRVVNHKKLAGSKPTLIDLPRTSMPHIHRRLIIYYLAHLAVFSVEQALLLVRDFLFLAFLPE